MGVHFKAGGAFPFLNTEASEITNAHANLADLWGESGPELRERLCTAATPRQRFRLMESALTRRLLCHTKDQAPINVALKMFAIWSLGPSRLARARFLTTTVYSNLQFSCRAHTKDVLSNTKISTSPSFGGKG